VRHVKGENERGSLKDVVFFRFGLSESIESPNLDLIRLPSCLHKLLSAQSYPVAAIMFQSLASVFLATIAWAIILKKFLTVKNHRTTTVSNTGPYRPSFTYIDTSGWALTFFVSK
jgi:hypothetical protein